MKKQWKGFFLGVLVTAIVFMVTMPAVAAVRNLKADFMGIKIVLDNRQLTPKDANGKTVEPFAVDGTTYLPLRAVAEALGLEVGWNGPTKTVTLTSGGGNMPSTPTPTPNPSSGFNESTVLSQLKTTEYTYNWGSYHYVFLVVKNNSNYDIRLTATANFYDENGKIVGAKNTSEPAVERGQEVVLMFLMNEDFARADYQLGATKEDSYDCVLSNLTYKGTPAKDKIILTVTNTGSYPAEFVEAHVLFYKDGKLINHDNSYFTDDDYELKPGASMNKELSCYQEFDSYQVYFSGRHWKS